MTTVNSADNARPVNASHRNFEGHVTRAKVLAKQPENIPKVLAKETPKESPEFYKYEQIDKPTAGRITYREKDGAQVTVDKNQNPELYKAVVRDYWTMEAMKSGHTLSLDNEDKLALLDYNDPSKVDRSHAAEGVITFEFGANKIVINNHLTPDTFARFDKLQQLQSFKDSGKIVSPGQELPVATTAYKDVQVLAPGILLAQTSSGEQYVVSKDLTPELFKQLDDIKTSKAALADGKAKGYEAVTELPKGLDPGKLQVDQVDKDSGVILFQYDGKKYAMSAEDALDWDHTKAKNADTLPAIYFDGYIHLPETSNTIGGGELYNTLFIADKVKGKPAEQALKDAFRDNQRVVSDDQPLPKLAEIESIEATAEGVLKVKLKRGDTQIVLEDVSAKAFKQYADFDKTLDGVKAAEEKGFKLVADNEYLSSTEDVKQVGTPDEFGPGLITYVYQKPGGEEQKLLVSKDYNPELYKQIVDTHIEKNSPTAKQDEFRAKHGLPPESQTTVDSLLTNQKDESGKQLTVQDLELKMMFDEYRAGIKDGSIGRDDPRAKLVRALEAKMKVENGMAIVPNGSTDTIYVAPGEPMWLNSRDVRDQIFDAKAIDEAIGKGMSDPKIQEDMKRFQTNARSQVEGGDEKIKATEQALEHMANSDEFRLYIKDLQDNGMKDLAEAEIQKTYVGLAQIDPKKADQFLQDLSRDGMLMELDKIMGDPSSVSPENAAAAGTDVTNFILRGMRAAGDLPSHLINAYETTFQKIYQNKSTAADIDKVWLELGAKAKTGDLTNADISEALNKTESFKTNGFSPLSATEKNNVLSMFTNMKDAGVLGSISGTMGLIRGVYQLVGNPTNLAATAEGRLAIASDFVTFLSFSNGFTTLGSKTFDHIFNTKTNAKFGLTTPVPDLLWGKDPTLAPSTQHNGGSTLQKALNENYWFEANKGNPFANDVDTNTRNLTPLRGGPYQPTLSPDNMESFAKGMRDGAGVKYGINSNTAFRIAGSVSRVLGAGGDFAGGIMGIVLSAFGIRDAVKSGDKLQLAASSLGIVAGVGSTIGGIASINGAFAVVGGTIGRAISFAGPVGFIVGAVISFAGAFINVARSYQLQKISQQDWKNIQDFKQDGLLKEHGDEAYTWVQTYMHNWGQRDTPQDQSIFDYRADEWNARQTHRGLEHENYEGDGENAWQTEFPEQSAGNFVQ